MTTAKTAATAQRVFVRAANDPQSTCSKRRPRFSREEITGSSGGRFGNGEKTTSAFVQVLVRRSSRHRDKLRAYPSQMMRQCLCISRNVRRIGSIHPSNSFSMPCNVKYCRRRRAVFVMCDVDWRDGSQRRKTCRRSSRFTTP